MPLNPTQTNLLTDVIADSLTDLIVNNLFDKLDNAFFESKETTEQYEVRITRQPHQPGLATLLALSRIYRGEGDSYRYVYEGRVLVDVSKGVPLNLDKYGDKPTVQEIRTIFLKAFTLFKELYQLHKEKLAELANTTEQQCAAIKEKAKEHFVGHHLAFKNHDEKNYQEILKTVKQELEKLQNDQKQLMLLLEKQQKERASLVEARDVLQHMQAHPAAASGADKKDEKARPDAKTFAPADAKDLTLAEIDWVKTKFIPSQLYEYINLRKDLMLSAKAYKKAVATQSIESTPPVLHNVSKRTKHLIKPKRLQAARVAATASKNLIANAKTKLEADQKALRDFAISVGATETQVQALTDISMQTPWHLDPLQPGQAANANPSRVSAAFVTSVAPFSLDASKVPVRTAEGKIENVHDLFKSSAQEGAGHFLMESVGRNSHPLTFETYTGHVILQGGYKVKKANSDKLDVQADYTANFQTPHAEKGLYQIALLQRIATPGGAVLFKAVREPFTIAVLVHASYGFLPVAYSNNQASTLTHTVVTEHVVQALQDSKSNAAQNLGKAIEKTTETGEYLALVRHFAMVEPSSFPLGRTFTLAMKLDQADLQPASVRVVFPFQSKECSFEFNLVVSEWPLAAEECISGDGARAFMWQAGAAFGSYRHAVRSESCHSGSDEGLMLNAVTLRPEKGSAIYYGRRYLASLASFEPQDPKRLGYIRLAPGKTLHLNFSFQENSYVARLMSQQDSLRPKVYFIHGQEADVRPFSDFTGSWTLDDEIEPSHLELEAAREAMIWDAKESEAIERSTKLAQEMFAANNMAGLIRIAMPHQVISARTGIECLGESLDVFSEDLAATSSAESLNTMAVLRGVRAAAAAVLPPPSFLIPRGDVALPPEPNSMMTGALMPSLQPGIGLARGGAAGAGAVAASHYAPDLMFPPPSVRRIPKSGGFDAKLRGVGVAKSGSGLHTRSIAPPDTSKSMHMHGIATQTHQDLKLAVAAPAVAATRYVEKRSYALILHTSLQTEETSAPKAITQARENVKRLFANNAAVLGYQGLAARAVSVIQDYQNLCPTICARFSLDQIANRLFVGERVIWQRMEEFYIYFKTNEAIFKIQAERERAMKLKEVFFVDFVDAHERFANLIAKLKWGKVISPQEILSELIEIVDIVSSIYEYSHANIQNKIKGLEQYHQAQVTVDNILKAVNPLQWQKGVYLNFEFPEQIRSGFLGNIAVALHGKREINVLKHDKQRSLAAQSPNRDNIKFDDNHLVIHVLADGSFTMSGTFCDFIEADLPTYFGGPQDMAANSIAKLIGQFTFKTRVPAVCKEIPVVDASVAAAGAGPRPS